MYSFRHAICNEVYGKTPFVEACRDIRAAGYDGIEIAPFTLGESPREIPAAARKEYRDQIESEGLTFAGLHWLMVSPAGLHVTGPDAALREKSWRHVADLVDLCADLAGSPASSRVMIFGSPKQRCATGGLSPAEATRNYVEGLARIAPHAGSREVTILVEALPSNQCDVVTSLAEAASIVREINHPSIRTMFDTHNAVEEAEPHAVLVERYFDVIRHVHVNEMNGGHPGTADYNFRPVLATLARLNYRGFVSLEAFDFAPGASVIARESLQHLQREISQL